MNLLLLFNDDFVDFVGDANRVRISGRRVEHVRAVHRARVGDELRVGVVNGQLGRGVITALSDDALEMDVALDQAPPPPLPVTLVLALPRPKSLKKVLAAVTTMGVKRVVLLNTFRVEKSYWQSPLLRPTALREQLLLGLEQAGDTVLPEISLRHRFKPFVEDELVELARGTRALVAHPTAAHLSPRDVQQAVTLAVGPEGGFIPFEVELLQAHGFEPVSLGVRRLRVEHAVPALLGRLF